MDADDKKFAESGQSDVKIEIALRKYLAGDESIYKAYIEQRAYSALLFLVKGRKVQLLAALLQKNPVDSGMKIRLLDACPNMDLEVKMVLMQGGNVTKSIVTNEFQNPLKSTLARLKFYSRKLGIEHPALRIPLSKLQLKQRNEELNKTDNIENCLEKNRDIFATDGAAIFYLSEEKTKNFETETNLEEVIETEFDIYQHMIIHCLFGHVYPPRGVDPKAWNLSADAAATVLKNRIFNKTALGTIPHQENLLISEMNLQGIDTSNMKEIYRFLIQNPTQITEDFCMDDHSFWYRKRVCTEDIWSRAASRMGAGQGQGTRGNAHAGLKPGSRRERMLLREEGQYDFGRYLERFSVEREEMQLDFENFSYIPYCYGMKYYGNMPFIEPLEYTEASKVEELVIAIDTSGSCSKDTVQRFLSETRKMLTEKENFFRRMNVHILQCDSMIQQHQVIHSVEEWNRYIQEIKIEGRGGTDFNPVFSFTDKLIDKGAIKSLKGLLYFTDGDGVYPSRKPVYETAFVFSNRKFLDYRIPDWIVPLCLE